MLIGPICQYPAKLVRSAHRIPRRSLFSLKAAYWSCNQFNVLRRVLQELLTQISASVVVSLRIWSSLKPHTDVFRTVLELSGSHRILNNHTEHPKWLKLVGILQRWGHLLVMSRSTTSWLKERPCHTDGPSPNSSKCRLVLAITQNMPD